MSSMRSIAVNRNRFRGRQPKRAPREATAPSALHWERIAAAIEFVKLVNARSVLDLGCGAGDLLLQLSFLPQLKCIIGVDICDRQLALAREAILTARPSLSAHISITKGDYSDPTLVYPNMDAAVMLETLEHHSPARLTLVERTLFQGHRPAYVLISTPNSAFNALRGARGCPRRHPEHRFEWDRPKFRRWARGAARRNNYLVDFDELGPLDSFLESPTQLAKFRKIPFDK